MSNRSGDRRYNLPPSAGEPRVSLLIALEDKPGALVRALAAFSDAAINLTHIESRPAHDGRFDFFVDCVADVEDARFQAMLRRVHELSRSILVLDSRQVPWFPRHITDLNQISARTLDAGSELDADHPGFQDHAYRARRNAIDALARAHRIGEPLPKVTYEEREQATWRRVVSELAEGHTRHACSAYRRALTELEQHCGLDEIPQLQQVSRYLQARTGFQMVPVPGLLSSRDFLAGLAFRVFFCTQYIRHPSKPLYTPEPDVCHELLGHAPMFASAEFADLSCEIGLASLGASDADIERLARCYWHSVEFGLVMEGGERKAYGAGLLSSIGELEHAFDPQPAGAIGRDNNPPQYLVWEPLQAAEQGFPITEYQPRYFVAESLADATDRMRDFCKNLARPFYARYQPHTQTVWVDRAVRREAIVQAS